MLQIWRIFALLTTRPRGINMATQALKETIEYIDKHSFSKLKYDTPRDMTISGKRFAIARLSRNGECPSYEMLVKFIENNGGTVRPDIIQDADYLIITPRPSKQPQYGKIQEQQKAKKELEKYEQAVSRRKETGLPMIVRDIDFYIVNDMFSKVSADDKRRMVLEYVKGNPHFPEKTIKKVLSHISQKARDDAYLRSKPAVMEIASQQAGEKAAATGQLPNEQTGTLREWRKHFSFSEVTGPSGPRLVLKKCKTMLPTLRLPAYIEGKPVVAVERSAFVALDSTVKEIIIPDTVIRIASHAFYQCSGLKRIVIEYSDCLIDRYSFAECPELQEVIWDGVNAIDRVDKISGRQFVLLKLKL